MKMPVGTYTLYNNFENCPHKAWHMYVLKDLPRVETKEMAWGNEVHTAMEHRVRDGQPLPDTMAAAEPVASTLHKLKDRFQIHVEYKLAIDKDGRPTDFWSDACWFRGKLDVATLCQNVASAWVLDWKTGKVREEPFELECGALLLKANYNEITHIVGEYFWLQTGQNGTRYTLNDHERTFGRLQSLRAEMQRYAHSGEWPKRKNPLCGWCPVTSCENNTSHRRK